MPIRVSKRRVALDVPFYLSKSSSLASASTVDLSMATGNEVHITGSTGPITSLGTVQSGAVFTLIFDSTPTLTYNATSLILNTGGINYTASAGDRAIALSEGSGNWVVSLVKKDGTALVVSDASSAVSSVTYDSSNRVATYVKNSVTYTCSYYTSGNGIGQIQTLSGGGVTVTYSYGSNGKLTGEVWS